MYYGKGTEEYIKIILDEMGERFRNKSTTKKYDFYYYLEPMDKWKNECYLANLEVNIYDTTTNVSGSLTTTIAFECREKGLVVHRAGRPTDIYKTFQEDMIQLVKEVKRDSDVKYKKEQKLSDFYDALADF